MASEFFGGLFFLVVGSLSIVLNKPGARLFNEYQKHLGLELNSYKFGRAVHIGGGITALAIGFMMSCVDRR